MGKTRPGKRRTRTKASDRKTQQDFSPEKAQGFIEDALDSLHCGQAEHALSFTRKALKCLFASSQPLDQLPALELLGEIYVELGDPDAARATFSQAVNLDPDGLVPEEAGGGADKFCWLAQLCETGGMESVNLFEKGCGVLRREIGTLEATRSGGEETAALDGKKRKLANALCSVAEIYMTDLSWNEEAEARCEVLVTEACVLAPDISEPLQTLASVRISQSRIDDARSALSRSIETWSNLPENDPNIPDFPVRISLSRLLMEVEMEEKAVDVLDRLIQEDDSSVEAWYLGGWCHYLRAKKLENLKTESINDHAQNEPPQHRKHLSTSRDWLQNCLKLYNLQEYEDEKLHEHANELVTEIDQVLGPQQEGNAEEDDDEADWEDEEGDSDEDEDMHQSEDG